ncbi:hypothetical protein [Streptomyces kanamyceticus]|uniref:DNA-binding protein n=1 Tax=Streptomyces kanamyceticus TaxID=1967 RepID=A0A5J6GB60_STRKN|nr:hypothetical protein [Streptomyces kanamyceticus]QEU91834.1 hypothetical protein CP970_13900 [Streptomyces kanamyceticus]
MTVALPHQANSSTVYVDWVRAHDPAALSAAEDLADKVRDDLRGAYEKPGQAMGVLELRAGRLPSAHLPWFWDMVGHRFCGTSARYAGKAYGLARRAEKEHRLPLDTTYQVANALLYAREGALPSKEMGAHQRALAAALPGASAHQEFVRFLDAWSGSSAGLGADLVTRLRASARGAGLGVAEEARVLGDVLRRAAGKSVPDALFDAAARVFAASGEPLDDSLSGELWGIFPGNDTDGAAWLRMLDACGAVDAVTAGRAVPVGGLAGWLERFAAAYAYRRAGGGGIRRQQMPVEVLHLVDRIAPRLRGESRDVRLHRTKWSSYTGLDADLLDACLAAGVPVHDPGERVRLTYWGERSHRDLKALAGDPVFGPRLEGTVHARVRRGTAVALLPDNEGISAEVHERVERLLKEVRGGGVAGADEALRELGEVLDRPTVAALGGLEEALAGLDLVGPLARALRGGLVEEFGWPALEEALAEFPEGEALSVTSTWPVLTVYSRERAIAVDHERRRAAGEFTLPEDATMHSVHYAGGRFLVGWSVKDVMPLVSQAFWTDRPQDVFRPEDPLGMVPFGGSIDGALGFQFESADGQGRYDGQRIMRPGDRCGIADHEQQLSDGSRYWGSSIFGNEGHRRGGRDAWARFDPATGERGEQGGLPDFPGAPAAPATEKGLALDPDEISLAALPPGAGASPLGQAGRLVGCRVLFHTGDPEKTRRYVVEGIDGRRARFRITRQGQTPWGILRMPEGGEDGVLAETDRVRCHSADDGSLLWELPGFPDKDWLRMRRAAPGLEKQDRLHTAERLPAPPPAFWHFLSPRDPASSKALRAATEDTARALLDAARREEAECAVRAELARVLPGVTEARIADAVVRTALRAADILRRRAELSRLVDIMRAPSPVALRVQVPDSDLKAALRAVITEPWGHAPAPTGPTAATLTALAADGRYLRGEIDDDTRRLSTPAPPADWTPLLGHTDAVSWRAATEATPDAERAALAELLRVWAEQPFAEAEGGGEGEGEIGTGAEADMRARARAGTGTDTGTGAEADMRARARAGTGTDTGAGAGAGAASEAGTPATTDAGARPGTGTGTDTGARPGTSTGAEAGTRAATGAGAGAATDPADSTDPTLASRQTHGWRTGRARAGAIAARRAAGGLVVASALDDRRFASRPDPVLRFVQRAAEPAPEGAEECVTVVVGRDEAGRIGRLLELLGAHGPFSPGAEAVEEFCRITGVRRAVGRLVLDGLPGRDGSDEHRKLLRAAPYRAGKDLQREYDDAFSKLGLEGRREILAAGLPDATEELAELWTEPGARAAARRMAEVWNDRIGARPYVDEDLADALDGALGLGPVWAQVLAGAAPGDVPTEPRARVLLDDGYGGLALHHARQDGSPFRPAYSWDLTHLQLPSVLAWALTERPVGDIAAGRAAGLYGALLDWLRSPDLLLPLGRHRIPGGAAEFERLFGPTRHPLRLSDEARARAYGDGSGGTGGEPVVAYDDGLLVVGGRYGDVFIRPRGLDDTAKLRRVERLCAELDLPDLLLGVRRVQTLYDGGGLARMVERAADSPVPAGGYELDPRLSAPGLVAEAAESLGVGTDAAALQLQLLALPRPADRDVRRWNGWTAARHKAVQAELAAAGAVETGKRSRAGRTAFVPGGWTEAKAPHLPLETAKLDPHLAESDASGELTGPFLRLFPPVPPHELFARAWARTGE